jgi:diketogulonate reductase-like aldo/keto reductase
MILQENFTLSNGVKIPKIGFGTWLISNDAVVEAVKEAIRIGYRHIDTAQAYGNERGVGEAIRASGLERKDIFVTSKVAAELKSYKEAVASIDESLKKLRLDYIDLMIIHSPRPWREFHGKEPYFKGNREVWKALEEAYTGGKLFSIGLSNFEEADIDNILDSCSVKPMVNQILVHISNTPLDLIAYSQSEEMLVEAYSPIGHGELLKDQRVAEVAGKYGVSIAQLGIRYCLQLDLLPLPKTTDPKHMKADTEVDFVISEEDMDYLKNIELIDYGAHSGFPVFGKK